jgi:hypothetical protein
MTIKIMAFLVKRHDVTNDVAGGCRSDLNP